MCRSSNLLWPTRIKLYKNNAKKIFPDLSTVLILKLSPISPDKPWGNHVHFGFDTIRPYAYFLSSAHREQDVPKIIRE